MDPLRRWLAPALVAAWCLVGLLLAFFDRPLSDALWVLMLSVWGLYVVLGAALFIALLWRLRLGRPRLLAFSAASIPVIAVVLLFVVPWVAAAGDSFQFARRFSRLEPQYEAIITALSQERPLVQHGTIRGITFVVDSGPPLRVAFPQPGGLIDNWEGVVYDPSGRVGLATGWKNGVAGDYTAPPDIKRVFGGDLVGCQQVAARFYRCWFT